MIYLARLPPFLTATYWRKGFSFTCEILGIKKSWMAHFGQYHLLPTKTRSVGAYLEGRFPLEESFCSMRQQSPGTSMVGRQSQNMISFLLLVLKEIYHCWTYSIIRPGGEKANASCESLGMATWWEASSLRPLNCQAALL